jgi:hypothetical protein
MPLIVVGDIHAQVAKFWRIFRAAGLCDAGHRPLPGLLAEAHQGVVLLGDLVHAKSRERYAELTGIDDYDEHNPDHLACAEREQEAFLRDVMNFQAHLPEGRMTILLGNHDHNAIDPDQGPLRTDDVSHLEWKPPNGQPLPADLTAWIANWPRELALGDLHLAHVGPRPEHNTFDNAFYLENRRRWIYDEGDALAGLPYRLGIYGHTPVRGGVSMTSQGRALLLDTNGHADEFVFLEVHDQPDGYRLRMQGLFYDEVLTRHPRND